MCCYKHSDETGQDENAQNLASTLA
jgi:hypothetical protein